MADDDEQAHREQLRKEYKRRLYLLELRKARQGDGADPALDLEIENIRANLAALDLADTPQVAPETQALIRNRFADDFAFLLAQFASITTRQTRAEERVIATEERVARIEEEAHDWRTRMTETLTTLARLLEHERTDRIAGQHLNLNLLRRTFWILVVVGILTTTIVAILLYVFG